MNRVNVDISANVEGYVKGIDQATQSTEKYETETRKVADAQVNLMKELKAAKREVQNLAAGYAKLDEEAKKSAFGQEMARQLQIAKEKAAEYIDLQGDLNTELRNMASDTAVLDTLSDGLSGLGHTMSAVTGVMGIFTDDTELMTKAVTMFTTAESIASAAIKVKNLLQRQSSLMLGIGRMQQLAATAAVELDTAAKGKNAIATGAATVAQKALNAAANANPYVLLATAVLGVVSALGFFTSSSEDAEKAQQRLNQQLAEGTARAIEYANAMNSVYDVVLKYMNEVGAASWEIEDKKLEAATDKANRLKEIWYEVSHNRGEGESYEAWTQRIDQAYQAWKAAEDARIKVEDDIRAHRRAVQDLIDNWENLDTEKQIRAAISAFQNLRSEYRQGTAEYNEMGRRIEILQKKINPKTTTIKPIKVNTTDTKKEIKTYEEAIAEYDKLTNRVKNLNQFIAEGRVDPQFLDKFKEEIQSIQNEIDRIAVNWHINAEVEKPDTQLQKLQKAITDAQQKYIIAVDADDKSAQQAALEEYYAAQKTLDEYKLKITIEPRISDEEVKKQRNEISKIVQEAYKPEDQKFDFSGLSESAQKEANATLEQFNKIKEARDKLVEIMNNPNSSDTQISAAQDGIDSLSDSYNTLESIVGKYQEMSDAAIKVAENNKKISEGVNSIGNAVQSAGEMFSALGKLTQDKGLQTTGLIAEAVATVALSFARALTTAKTWVDWLAFGLSGAATMINLIAQIKSATAGAYAQGGIVGGSSFSGDRLTARVNSGEMILNQRQQKNLFNLLDNDAMPKAGGTNVQVTGVIHGTDLLLVQKNTNKILNKTGNKINF